MPKAAALPRAALLLLLLIAPAAHAQSTAEWPAELGAALTAYQRADFAAAERLAGEAAGRTRDARVRSDAALLNVLIQVRSATRSEREGGLHRLAQLASDDLAIVDRPEVQFARASAHLALFESAAALDQADAALTGFLARGQNHRAAEALLLLADAWATHADWAATPPALGQFRPADRQAAMNVRRAQIEKLLARTTEPALAAAAAAVELRLARLELSDPSAEMLEAGLARLDRIASAVPLTPAAAEAGVLLAERLADHGRPSAALEWLDRVASGGAMPWSGRAREAAQTLRTPALSLDFPRQSDTRSPVAVHIHTRNIRSIRLEARRVDLAAWLRERRGALAENAMPSAGALLAGQSIELEDPSDQLAASREVTLAPAAPPGAYVVAATARTTSGDELRSQRLLTVSDWNVDLAMGRESAALWLDPPADGAAAPAAEAQAEFWMQGSFVPLVFPVRGGAACWALPGEAALLREKRWVCVVRAGEHTSILTGDLHDVPARGGRAALLASRVAGPAGQSIRVSGLLLEDPPPHDSPLQVEVRDSADRPLFTLPVTADPAGFFETEFLPGPTLAGASIAISLRRGARVFENLRGSLKLFTERADVSPLQLDLRAPRHVAPGHPPPTILIGAAYPWGTPVQDTATQITMRIRSIPVEKDETATLLSRPFGLRTSLDPRGRGRYTLPTSELLSDVPASLLRIDVQVAGPDQGRTTRTQYIFAGEHDSAIEVAMHPAAPEAGEEVEFHISRLDPFGFDGAPTDVAVVDALGQRHPLPVRRHDEHLRAGPWRPAMSGSHQLEIAQPRRAGEPLTLRRAISVGDGPLEGAGLISATSRLDGKSHTAVVTIRGQVHAPLALLIEDREPLAAALAGSARLPAGALGEELSLTLIRAPRGPARARLLQRVASEWRELQAVDLAVAETPDPVCELSVAETPLRVGSTACIRLQVSAGGAPFSGSALVRLIPESGLDAISWEFGSPREPDAPWHSLLSSSQTRPDPADEDDSGAALRRLFQSGSTRAGREVLSFFGGATAAARLAPIADGSAEIDLPLPNRPGFYRVSALVRNEKGAQTLASIILDARGGAMIQTNIPRRLEVGDRSLASLVLENPGTEPLPVEVEVIDVGGFAVAPPQRPAPSADADPAIADTDKVTTLTLTDRPARLVYPIEAVLPGTSEIRWRIRTPAGEQLVSAASNIDEPPPPTPDAPIRVQRQLFRLTERHIPDERVAPEGDDRPVMRRVWDAAELDDGTIVSPGETLLVRENWTVAREVGPLQCVQPIPATCFTRLESPEDLRQLARVRRTRLEEYTWSLPSLAAGQWTHEYVMVVTRPGSTTLSPPEVRLGPSLVIVEVTPEITISAQGD